MENKAKIRYRIMPVFETGVAFQILYMDKRAYNGTPDLVYLFDNMKLLAICNKDQVMSFDSEIARNNHIESIHSALAEFAVRWDGFNNDAWYWKETEFESVKHLREYLEKATPEELERDWKEANEGFEDVPGPTVDEFIESFCFEPTPGEWLPWSPDMPIPKPRSLGNNTWEV